MIFIGNGRAGVKKFIRILYSKEGVTKDDPLFMFMYVIGALPPIRLFCDPGCWTELWYIFQLVELCLSYIIDLIDFDYMVPFWISS